MGGLKIGVCKAEYGGYDTSASGNSPTRKGKEASPE